MVLIILFANNALAAADTQTLTPDYNQCAVLELPSRNECLLSLSMKQADLNGDLKRKQRFTFGLDFHSATYLDGSNYGNTGQFFYYVLKPSVSYQRSNGSVLELDMYLKEFNGTGADDPGTYSYGRPGLKYIPKFVLEGNFEFLPEFGVRFPNYSESSNSQDLDPYGFKKIWKFTIAPALSWKQSDTQQWILSAAIEYQTDKNYSFDRQLETPPGPPGIQNAIRQQPLMTIVTLKHVWHQDRWTIGAGFRTEQTLNRGRTLLLGAANDETQFVSVATNNILLDAIYRFSPDLSAGLTITKSLNEPGYQGDYVESQFDDPIYGSNFSAGAVLKWLL